MSKVKETLRTALIVALALLLSMLLGILVARADGAAVQDGRCPVVQEVWRGNG